MDFGILNLIVVIDAKFDFIAFHRIFLIFIMLNLRFNKNNTKTSQTGRQIQTGSSLHYRLSTFLVWEVLLTVI